MKVAGIETTAARFAWFYTRGEWPAGEVEHANGDPLDCRFDNLRLANNLGAARPQLTAARLHEVLTYDPVEGSFTWTKAALGKSVRGKPSTRHNPLGYGLICIDRTTYRAHHLAWFWVYGAWPRLQLDHRNGDPSDNRIENLREATVAQNMANRRTPITNRSGYKGVSWHAGAGRWQAHIRHEGKSIYLGLHDTPQAAHSAYAAAALRLKGEFARLN